MSPQPVDLSPLWKIDPDLSQGLARAFGDYENLALQGVQQHDGRPRGDGVVEMWAKDYFFVRDGKQEWMIWARAELFDSTTTAIEWLEHECALQGEMFGSEPELLTHRSWHYCKTPIGQLRNDPEGGRLPSQEYVSFVGIQFDQLVLTLDEIHHWEAKTAKNELIVEVAERLARLRPTSSEQPGH